MTEVALVLLDLLQSTEAWSAPTEAEVRELLSSNDKKETPACAAARRAFLDALGEPEPNKPEAAYAPWVRHWVDTKWHNYHRPRRRAVIAALRTHPRPLVVLRKLLNA